MEQALGRSHSPTPSPEPHTLRRPQTWPFVPSGSVCCLRVVFEKERSSIDRHDRYLLQNRFCYLRGVCLLGCIQFRSYFGLMASGVRKSVILEYKFAIYIYGMKVVLSSTTSNSVLTLLCAMSISVPIDFQKSIFV